MKKFSRSVKFSIIMPVYNPKENHLIDALDSVIDQVYTNWELCIADDKSTNRNIIKILKKYEEKHTNVKVVYRAFNGHISEASNSAIEICDGDYIALFDQDDILPQHALFKMAEYINNFPDAKLLFSDEDKIKENGNRFDPYFKFGWNKELFYGQNFISHLGVYDTTIVKYLGGFRKGYEGSQDYDLTLRFIEQIKEENIIHVPHVLYHWRYHNESASSSIKNKNYAPNAGLRALNDHFKRTHQKAFAELNRINYYKIAWEKPKNAPSIALIMITESQIELENIIREFSNSTLFSFVEIILPKSVISKKVISDNTNVKIKYFNITKGIVNSFNKAVEDTTAEVLLFSDTIISINQKVLLEIATQLNRKDVGILGFRNINSNKITESAGYFFSKNDIISFFKGSYFREVGYIGKATIAQEVSAIDIRFLATKKEIFNRVNGFDKNFKSSRYDFDYCFKVKELGYRVILAPYIEVSIVPVKLIQRLSDSIYFEEKWAKITKNGSINISKDKQKLIQY